MRLTRIYVDRPLATGISLDLPEAPSRHLSQVLRVAAGQPVTLFNGNGRDYEARVAGVNPSAVNLRVESEGAEEPPQPLAIDLAIGISKGDRMDFAIQKAVELGVASIQPLFTERSVVRLQGERLDRRHEHWRGIAIGACEQSGRRRLPQLGTSAAIADWLARGFADALLLDAAAPLSLAALPAPASGAITLLIGPEGGLSPRERDLAQRRGFLPVRLGPRILRTETAPIAAIAVLQALWGDLAR